MKNHSQSKNEVLSILFDNAPDIIFLCDSDGVFIDVNNEAEKISGYTKEEVIGKSFFDLNIFAPEDIPRVAEDQQLSFMGDGLGTSEYKLITKNGETRHIQVKAHTFKENDIDYMLGIARDVTERKLTEDTMKQSADLFRGFMESATDSFTIFDENLNFVEVNNTWLEVTHYKKEDTIGKHILEVYTGLKATGRYDAYLKVLETGVPVDFRAVRSNVGGGIIYDVSAFKAGTYLGVVAKDVSGTVGYQQRLETLHGHAASLSSAESIQEVADITKESVMSLLGYIRGSLALVEGAVLNHKYRWGIGSTDEFIMPLDGPGISVEVVNSGKSNRVGNILENDQYVEGLDVPGTNSELCVPVTVSGRIVAVINLESEILDAFSENDQKIVEILAQHVSTAISRIDYRNKLSTLHSFALELGFAESLDDIGSKTMQIMKDALGFDYSAILLVEGEFLVTLDVLGRTGQLLRLPISGKGLTTKAVREAKTVFVPDVGYDPDHIQASIKSLSEIDVPVIVDGKVIGVLNVESPFVNWFTSNDARLMEVLAQNVGAALSRIQSAEEKSVLERQVFVQQVQVEQEQELSRLKTEFMNTAAHEIRTPITSIQGYTEIIQDHLSSSGDEVLLKYFDAVARNSERLDKLSNDLLDLQRMEAGRMSLDKELVAVARVLSRVKVELSPILAVQNQNLDISGNFSEAYLTVDTTRLMQVLINLVQNASKFSDEGETIRINVTLNDNEVRFGVVDQGVGMSEEDISKLFQPFPDIYIDGVRHGTGLGLSICKGIVDLHNGKIWAESNGRGKGSTFIFTIPIK